MYNLGGRGTVIVIGFVAMRIDFRNPERNENMSVCVDTVCIRTYTQTELLCTFFRLTCHVILNFHV